MGRTFLPEVVLISIAERNPISEVFETVDLFLLAGFITHVEYAWVKRRSV